MHAIIVPNNPSRYDLMSSCVVAKGSYKVNRMSLELVQDPRRSTSVINFMYFVLFTILSLFFKVNITFVNSVPKNLRIILFILSYGKPNVLISSSNIKTHLMLNKMSSKHLDRIKLKLLVKDEMRDLTSRDIFYYFLLENSKYFTKDEQTFLETSLKL